MQGTDTDDVLGLQTAFRECKTPDEFYDRECEAVVNYVRSNPKGVVATGGSVVHREGAMKAIARSGAIVVFLDVPLDILKERLGDWSSRGIVLPDGIEDLDALYAFRRPLYEKWANLTLDTSAKSMESCVQAIEWLFG
jgi:shikimate kinase